VILLSVPSAPLSSHPVEGESLSISFRTPLFWWSPLPRGTRIIRDDKVSTCNHQLLFTVSQLSRVFLRSTSPFHENYFQPLLPSRRRPSGNGLDPAVNLHLFFPVGPSALFDPLNRFWMKPIFLLSLIILPRLLSLLLNTYLCS
jgi:hypothetical protein